MGFCLRLVCTVFLGFASAHSHAGAVRSEAPASGPPAGVPTANAPVWSHAFAVFGEPKYPAGFAHYDYVNPDAPKRGTLNLGNPDRRSSFSRLNPYLLKGNGAFGSYFFCFETLFDPSQDEAGVMYGLVAEAIQVAPDLSWVTFRINPRAHFNNGDPVTAADVKYAFDAVTGDKADPGFAAQFANVKRAVIVDALTVRFELAVRSREAIYALGTDAAGVLAQVGHGRRRQDQALRQDHRRRAHRHRRLRRRQDLLGAPPRPGARPELLGPQRRRAARLLQLRQDRLPLLRRPRGPVRGLQGGRHRPLLGNQPQALGPAVQGREVRPRPDRRQGAADGPRRVRASLCTQPAASDLPGHPRARSAATVVRLRVDERAELQPVRAHRQCVQQLGFRGHRPAVAGRAGDPRAVPRTTAGGGVRPAVRRTRAPTPARRRCATTSSAPAICSRRPAGSPAPTSCCAMPRARCSASSC